MDQLPKGANTPPSPSTPNGSNEEPTEKPNTVVEFPKDMQTPGRRAPPKGS